MTVFRLLTFVAAAFVAIGAPVPLLAQSAPQNVPQAGAGAAQVAPLLPALGIDRLLPIMRQEGQSYAEDLAGDMFPGRVTGRWQREVDRIYDVDRMRADMIDGLARSLPPEAVAPVLDFFTSDLGTRIVRLETGAREALLDEAVEAASEETLAEMRREADPRLTLIERFVEVNDLVEMNVVGALNSNFAFYRGLSEGGAFDGALTEREMLADVWAQEPEIRAETETWVHSYLALAYGPLGDADLEAYIALSDSAAGRALNTALFAAFDEMFVRISGELGAAAAQIMSAEDI